eukprot:580630-Pyramimonas_sp.AAC.1
MYDGHPMSGEENDAAVLLAALGRATEGPTPEGPASAEPRGGGARNAPSAGPSNTVNQILSAVQGPWALLYWQ